MQTPLQTRIFEQLRLHLIDNFNPGDRINEAEMAERLGVSRTPIRRVLMKLQSEGALTFEPRRGFVVRDPAVFSGDQEDSTDAFLDERVMRDMAIGDLRGVISERAMMQRYSVPNGVLVSTLRRLTRDRLVEPSPGRGWIFADVSPRALDESYRFRQILEPASLLSDGYKVSVEVLQRLDADHVYAIENIEDMGRRRLFDLDARFHREIAEGAQTAELLNAVERQNNMRRVAEYIGFIRLERIRQSMCEHRDIISALIDGNRQLARL
ncbi:GntR family transcriptional regulator [Neoaquamicrobium sediminum]|uniref:GntR family transcriptional regulator n=1 Tax=Neoaquamicrobium sediminum TaxID=1849104 RepID=UPI001566B369|nr:GntR family transcriptional regulator [Mesorhizobium sediminum]NRC57264.1 GntR family transcriptional regulator [Mesorhizobium sediminum]